MKKVFFVGSFFTKEQEKEIIECSTCGIQSAANKLQWMMIDGLIGNNLNVSFVSAPAISSYPIHYKKRRLSSPTVDYCGRNISIIKFDNLIIRKQRTTIRGIKDFFRKEKPNDSCVFFYAFTMYDYELFRWLKNNYDVRICLYLPDLPMHMGLQKKNSLLRKRLQNKKEKLLLLSKKYIDRYVLITNNMADYLNIADSDYIVIEGMVYSNKDVTDDVATRIKYSSMEKKDFVYTGAITEEFGVLSLIKQFMKIERDDISLTLCGNGADFGKAKELSKEDRRIRLTGTISNKEAIDYQQKAYALINPMADGDGISKYSFPSKMMEYLNSRSLVIGYKLSCYPKEYLKHLILINEEENGISEAINSSLNLRIEEIIESISSNQNFIHSKDNVSVCKRIIDFLEDCK